MLPNTEHMLFLFAIETNPIIDPRKEIVMFNHQNLSPLDASKLVLKYPGYCHVSPKFVALAMDDKTALILPGDFSNVMDNSEAVNLKIQELIKALL